MAVVETIGVSVERESHDRHAASRADGDPGGEIGDQVLSDALAGGRQCHRLKKRGLA
ncbi:hypothetical protein [Actinoplanes sp. NPDC049802]|uniref:hypothetical protein n=1 Tax=Actinoplanes sp. NPDC049802 TaxID=3154742 RepID=UPI00340E4751